MFLMFQTGLIATCGGFLFFWLNMPLPWTLGPLAAVLLWRALLHRPAAWPIQVRNGGMLFLGYAMGAPFTPHTAQAILQQLPAICLSTVLVIAISLWMASVTARYTDISLSSAFLGSTPGGLTQMTALSEEMPHTDPGVVTFLQTFRLLATVFTVPFLVLHGLADHVDVVGVVLSGSAEELLIAYLPPLGLAIGGMLIATKLHLPTPQLLGPILGTAIWSLQGYTTPPLPSELLKAAQWCVGTYMGLNIPLVALPSWKRLVPLTALSVALLLTATLGIGLVLSNLHGYSLATAFIATAPGGMAEMGLTAMMVHADLSIIISYQLFRLLFILLVIPPFFQWYFRRKSLL
ncbi:MAG: AbrB family transcriptional regulator [Anaeromusa sp.]|uniref:AbrB family transcriptional regulator n=1 Tax=Anaeromusa sp. TaxID=1872520 RepID=UPI002B219740|nr:AbrB family transcriptional regulator [Anaeromusa sp.]MEA4833592.1 AbrB family transcriptional regulator [Anaeromusa sp.]